MDNVELSKLHERMRLAVGNRSFRAIAEITGHKTETVRRYLTGQPPSIEFVAAFTAAFGLRADWLLTGRGAARVADERKHALKRATPEELLAAVADTVEVIQERVDRIERYVQTLETRTRGLAQLAHAQRNKARKREPYAPGQSEQSIVTNPERIADALSRRPPTDAH